MISPLRRPRFSFSFIIAVAIAFAVGYGVAAAVAGRNGGPASPQGAAVLYRQVLTDLQQDYYKPVDVPRLTQAGLNGLLKSLNDPYTQYFTPSQAKAFDSLLAGKYSGVGLVFQEKGKQLEVVQVLPGSPAALAHIRVGDVIVAVNGRPIAGQPVDITSARIQGPPGSVVHLQLRRAGVSDLIDVTLTRRELSFPLTSSRLITDHGKKVGYVALSQFSTGAGAAVQKAVKSLTGRGAQWLIFDLRDNGGGLVDEGVKVAGDFLPSGSVVVSEQGLHSPKEVLHAGGNSPTRLPLVVLVNGNTASASEIVAGALQDEHRATLIGARTYGKGVVQNLLPLPWSGMLKLTVASYRTPAGRDINHKGIVPSILVAAGAAAGKDAALQRALQFIVSGN